MARATSIIALLALLGACGPAQRPVTLHDADAPPQRLSDWGIVFADGDALTLNDGVLTIAVKIVNSGSSSCPRPRKEKVPPMTRASTMTSVTVRYLIADSAMNMRQSAIGRTSCPSVTKFTPAARIRSPASSSRSTRVCPVQDTAARSSRIFIRC